jgi:hypothetical protein
MTHHSESWKDVCCDETYERLHSAIESLVDQPWNDRAALRSFLVDLWSGRLQGTVVPDQPGTVPVGIDSSELYRAADDVMCGLDEVDRQEVVRDVLFDLVGAE